MRTGSTTSAFRLLGDQPYCEPNDPFNFSALAGDLKSLILSSRKSTPFTIGIEASWGRGKSSLMAQLHQELKFLASSGGVEIRPVTFNAWTAEGQDVLEGLVKSVLQAMDENALRRALRNKRLVGVLKIPLLLVAGWLRVGSLVDQAWNALSADARTRNQVNDVVTKAMKEWFAQAGEGRSGNPNAGFEDVQSFQQDGVYNGATIFYSSRISPAMRKNAGSLGAPIVASQADLMYAIGELISPRAPVSA